MAGDDLVVLIQVAVIGKKDRCWRSLYVECFFCAFNAFRKSEAVRQEASLGPWGAWENVFANINITTVEYSMRSDLFDALTPTSRQPSAEARVGSIVAVVQSRDCGVLLKRSINEP